MSEDVPYVDPHHRVPDNEWGQVRRDAQRFRQEHEEAGEGE
jgi:hypothetical protein